MFYFKSVLKLTSTQIELPPVDGNQLASFIFLNCEEGRVIFGKGPHFGPLFDITQRVHIYENCRDLDESKLRYLPNLISRGKILLLSVNRIG